MELGSHFTALAPAAKAASSLSRASARYGWIEALGRTSAFAFATAKTYASGTWSSERAGIGTPSSPTS